MTAGQLDTVRRAIGGHRLAQEQLWRQNRRWIGALLWVHGPRGVELEDLLQEVAVSFVQGVSGVRDPSRFRGWLRTLALNTARTAARKLARGQGGALEHGMTLRPGQEASEAAELRDEAERALAALAALPPDYREPLLLRATRGLTQRQIADLLGVPVTTVESRLARGRRLLRERLTPEGRVSQGSDVEFGGKSF